MEDSAEDSGSKVNQSLVHTIIVIATVFGTYLVEHYMMHLGLSLIVAVLGVVFLVVVIAVLVCRAKLHDALKSQMEGSFDLIREILTEEFCKREAETAEFKVIVDRLDLCAGLIPP